MSTISAIFSILTLLLKAFGLWGAFLDYLDAKYRADVEERRQKRDQAIDDSKKANTDDEIWKSQDGVVRNLPRP